jgi:predicted GIY-YIG superfamily endonuclease
VKAVLKDLLQTTNARAWFGLSAFHYVNNAIAREKQIKRWRREKKIALIKQENPTWLDLSEEWASTAGPSTTLRSGRDDNSA